MAAIQLTRPMEPKELRRLGRREASGRVASRMFAIANVLEGMNRTEAATHAGMERQCLRDWVHRFNAEGVEGLHDRPHRGRPSRMHAGIEKEFCERVDTGPDAETDKLVRWRRVDLQDWLKTKHAIKYHERSIGKILNTTLSKLEFSGAIQVSSKISTPSPSLGRLCMRAIRWRLSAFSSQTISVSK